jgi:very-short-patch-repair endonuclease
MASRLTLFTAAVDACGADALLSHFAAAELWGLMRRQNGPIDVTVVGRNPGTKGDGVRVHRTIRLDSRDVRTIQGVRVTSPARTLLDLAALVPDEQLEDLIAQARVQRLVTERAIHVVSDVYKTRPGAGRLRALTERELGTGYTRSRAERLLVKLIRQAQLPIPRTNVRLHGLEVDALWPEYRLVVEVDSFRFHGDRAAFERDRARDAKLVAAGYRVIRVTWRQLTEQPLTVVARIARALGAPEPAPS